MNAPAPAAHARPPLRANNYGFFGPDSPSWKVWAAPTAIVGFQRSVVLEHFDPFLAAAVANSQGIYRKPAVRLDHTLAYFLTVAVGDGERALLESEHLMGIHAAMTGIEPITGKRFAANNPASQLWIHVTGWHSVLKCYEMFGPGPLSADEEAQYWRECVIAADLQTCKTSDVPTNREEVREYFAQMRPQLCTSEAAMRGMHYLLRTDYPTAGLKFWLASRLMAPVTIATLPSWMRKLGGFDQPGVIDRVAIVAAKRAVRATLNPVIEQRVIGAVAPMTSATLREHRLSPIPTDPRVVTPAEIRAARTTAASTAS
ncbi:oxygenase MpaB family protein [Gordonia sp. CPCC 205333]|uniref:oxygenase MpaB family protein n=1 Tax=Gordonia sp. CPCC 205333 TaxID=3140790 RepID=UPI003AF3FB65